jgi:magnesium transporter
MSTPTRWSSATSPSAPSPSVWPSAVLRGDYGTITVGARTSVQDGTVIHAGPDFPTVVGTGCVIGHLAHLEGCVLEDDCLVGSGSVVLHHAVIGSGATVGANAVVPNRMAGTGRRAGRRRPGRPAAGQVEPGLDPVLGGRVRGQRTTLSRGPGSSRLSTPSAPSLADRVAGPIHSRAAPWRQTLGMQGTLTVDGATSPATREAIEQRVASGGFLWLDLDGVDDEAHDLLLNVFKVHQLAVEDAQKFGQRPKLEDYADFMYMVVYGASTDQTATTEVHFIFADHFVVTVHHGSCGALNDVRARIGHRKASEVESPQIVLIYLVIDQLVDSFFPVLNQFDNQIDDLEDAILVKPTEAQLGTLFAMKRSLITIRKVVTPQRDMFASISSGVTELPGSHRRRQRYMRDIYDHLIRISDLIDGYRDLLSGVMDTHLSTVSNRLNVVMKQLTIIATVFLPLSRSSPGSSARTSRGWSPRIHRVVAVRYIVRHRPRAGSCGRAALPVPEAGLAGRTDQLSATPVFGAPSRTARLERDDMTESDRAKDRSEATPEAAADRHHRQPPNRSTRSTEPIRSTRWRGPIPSS